jgi:hypothetical protein
MVGVGVMAVGVHGVVGKGGREMAVVVVGAAGVTE